MIAFSKRIPLILYIIIIFVVHLTNNNVRAKSKVYLIENETFLDWYNAYKYCKNINMNLAMVKTREDFNYLKLILQLRYGRTLPYWLGAYKIDGVFAWAATGEKIRTLLWHKGEPNDRNGDEKCIYTWDEDFDWNDYDCYQKFPFICEGEA